MQGSTIDKSVQRVVVDGFPFPLGVYPIEPTHPRPGYTVDFESADGGEAESDWEEWPDRYMIDIAVGADRLRPLLRSLVMLLPTRVYPILDVLGEDAYREVDPYIAYDPAPLDRFLELVHRHSDWLFEDGLVGFGAMSEDPFLYVYLDEHKIVTVRVQSDLRERVERVLEAFDVPPVDELAGADAAAHEHRCVLDAEGDGSSEEEIIEELILGWRLQLNVDREANEDEAGVELGVTGWRCLVRLQERERTPPNYGLVWLLAGSYDEAESLAIDALAESCGIDPFEPGALAIVILADRMTPERFRAALEQLGQPAAEIDENTVGVFAVRPSGED